MAEAIHNTIILLLGFAGTGKYTIGKEIADRTGAKLIHNHLIANPLFTALDADGVKPLPPGIWDKVMRARRLVYETIRELSPPGLSFVFTGQWFEEDPQDQEALADLVDLAAARQSVLVPVRLICELEELCRRIASPERAAMLKQITPQAARDRAATKSVLNPRHPNVLTIDVTSKTAADTADEIINHARLLTRK